MIFGYIRVSKEEQNYDLQIDALKKAGCQQIFKEKISGASKHRPEYEKLLSHLREGDVVVIWRIDRLGRTTLELIKLMVEFREKGVEFKSLTEGIDTTTPMGRIWFMLNAVFAENEREIIRERSRAGLAAARARGRLGGRPKGISKDAAIKASFAALLYKQGKSIKEIREKVGIASNATVYKYLKSEGVEIKGWVQSR
ncbi:recombinase family protein [Cesiribacter sp. SM1]|uniref:recombinase family protein n=1 Tax=Cesiribacter sp. SM1 TaxID=2861196 RepID=UPI001CD69CD0|nr:recombinase family protein [Cesiribacter sp. SM1]